MNKNTEKWKHIFQAAVLALTAAIAVCISMLQGSEQTLQSLTVGFSQSGTLNQWRVTESNDIIRAAEAAGCKLIYTDANDDIEKQNADILWLVAQSPDYIIITPRDYYGLEEGLAAAKAADIPVIVIERNVNGLAGEDYMTVIKSNLTRQGEMCAEYLVSVFGDRQCRILEVVGSELSSPSMERSKGFRTVINQYENYQIVATGAGNYTRGVARASIRALLEEISVERIDAIFAQNDDTAMDAIAAVEATGVQAGKDILIFSIDGSAEALKAILAGKLKMTIDDSPYYGDLVFETIAEVENKKLVPNHILREDGIVYDIFNAEEMLKTAY